MADSKTTQLAQLAATPDVADQLMIVDVSDTSMAASGTNKRLAASYLARSDAGAKLITGNNRELTVPATGTAALIGISQTFADAQAIAPSATNVNGLEVNMPTSTSGKALQVKYAGTERALLQVLGGQASAFILSAVDTGNSYGPYIAVLGNSNGSTPSAGVIVLRDKGATDYSIWPDDSGVLRINTTLPTNALDTAGTVVGAQTSSLDAKHIVDDPISVDEVLAAVAMGADAVRRFTYRNGAYNGEEFSGVVTDFAPRYGMDRDAEHPAGKSLNTITAIGDLLIAVGNLIERVAALEAKVK